MATEPKRFKLEDCPPSKVILVMDLVASIGDKDIVALFSRYGNVIDMLRLGQGRSALVEFDNINVSKMLVSQSKNNAFFIGNTQVKMAFGNSANIVRKKGVPFNSMSVLGHWPHPTGPGPQQQMPIGGGGGGGNNMMMGGPPPPQQQQQQQMGMQGGMGGPPQPPPPHQQQQQQQQQPPHQAVPVPAAPSLAMQGLPGRVLLFSITNAVYPITVDVMKAICSPNGNLLRVSIGQKKSDDSMEALVEFENVGDANKAIESLNGADIYSGCCTLSITVSHLPVLQVYKNDAESCDFTNPNLGVEKAPLLGSAPPQQQQQLPPPTSNYYQQQQQPPPQYQQQQQQQPPPIGSSGMMMHGHQQQGGPMMPPPPHHQQYQQQQPYQQQQQQQQRFQGGGGVPEPWMFQKGEGTVIMAYNLPNGLTCQNIFNIVCLYGNVARIKFLKSREGCAMIQMGTPEQCGYVVDHLSGLTIFGQKVEVCRSKQPEVQVNAKPDLMDNGTPISMCYEDSVNNRFKRPDMFTKSRLVAPTQTLHFFNFPSATTEHDLCNFLMQNGGPKPDKAVVFKPKQADQKAAIGLIEFDSVENAVLALMRSNHAEIRLNERTKFHAKLSFSTKPVDPTDSAAISFNQSQQPVQPQQQQKGQKAPAADAATISKPAAIAKNGVENK